MANREHGEWNHPARYQWGAADIYTADHESSRPENRHRSKWAQARQQPVARKDDNAYGSRKDGRKKHSQQCIGPGFYIPRYKRASYPEAVLYPNDDPHPAKRPIYIYDDFRHPKHVPKPARWEEILEEFDRLWKLSRSYQLKEFRKKADPSRPVSEQNFNKQTDLKYKIPSPRRTRSCPVSPQKARKRAFKPWIP